ncbi:MAG TPA: hypothetical protein DCF63_09725 [Planctomycetaceae bacterium]|nr:hypothetical protein [Planctomycetaceae bacterium]
MLSEGFSGPSEWQPPAASVSRQGCQNWPPYGWSVACPNDASRVYRLHILTQSQPIDDRVIDVIPSQIFNGSSKGISA